MSHAFSRVSKFERTEAGIGFRLSRTLLIYIVALAGTTIWAGILYFAGWAFGIVIATYWLTVILGAIFLLLLLGLSIVAVGSDDIG